MFKLQKLWIIYSINFQIHHMFELVQMLRKIQAIIIWPSMTKYNKTETDQQSIL